MEGCVWTDATFQAVLHWKEEEQVAVAAKKTAAVSSHAHLAEICKEHKAWKVVVTAAHKLQQVIDLTEWEVVVMHKVSRAMNKGRAPKKPAAQVRLVVPKHLLSPQNSDSKQEDLGNLGGEELESDEDE
ncbi:hypothetical protein FRB94_002603 [Tulasnella sp. JGI-2019a]|nr:hypothetical protein FRB94_002603 [Tulasnella sp. JGI-2019a]